ncbi:MAG: hypothetical protein PUD81_01185 [Eggerthellales bacterium]|nr:hypothetical protein [Eggerthellales bacterium]
MKHATDAALEESTSRYSLSTKVLSIALTVDKAVTFTVAPYDSVDESGSEPSAVEVTYNGVVLMANGAGQYSFSPVEGGALVVKAVPAATPRGRVNSCRRCRALSQYPSAAKRSWQRFRLCIILGPDYIGAVFSPVLLNC